jgi:hypothetical protein
MCDMGHRRLERWIVALALCAASACPDDREHKPRVVNLASNVVVTEDGGSKGATAGSQPAAEVDEVGPSGLEPDAGAGKGTLSREALAELFDRGAASIKKCYERDLKRVPTLAGKLDFAIKIGRTGKVEAIRIKSSTLKNKLVERCIATTIKRWKFPRPTGDAEVVNYLVSIPLKNN